MTALRCALRRSHLKNCKYSWYCHSHMEVVHTLGYEIVKADLFGAAGARAVHGSTWWLSSVYMSHTLVSSTRWDFRALVIFHKNYRCSICSRPALLNHFFYYALLPIKMERGEIATGTTFGLTAPLFFTLLSSNFPTIFFIVRLNFIRWLHVGYFLKIPSGKWKITEKLPKTPHLLRLHSFVNHAGTWYTASTHPSAQYVVRDFF